MRSLMLECMVSKVKKWEWDEGLNDGKDLGMNRKWNKLMGKGIERWKAEMDGIKKLMGLERIIVI